MARSTIVRRLPRPPFAAPGRWEPMNPFHGLFADGTLEPIVDRMFTLDRVSYALALAFGRASGGIVIVS